MAGVRFFLAALALQPAPQPPVAPGRQAGADDILVLAHRLRKVRWEYEARDGALLRCVIRRSSGSARLDGLLCPATAQCAAEQPATRDAELAPCIRDRVRRLYAAR